MKKAVLIFDMPKGCCECKLNDHNNCLAADKDVENKCVEEYWRWGIAGTDKPNWCPLRKLPKKDKSALDIGEYNDGYTMGWNAYRDKLLGKNKG